jgi:hypothetical protein
MKEEKKAIPQISSLEEFEQAVNLYRLISGGTSRKGLVLLRKIVDLIHYNNYFAPGTKLPSILICGEGARTHSYALINSLCCEDVRECSGKFFDRGIPSKVFFEESTTKVVHLITNIENIGGYEAILWDYLRNGRHRYEHMYGGYEYIHCNGMILLTTSDLSKVSQVLIDTLDYIVRLEPYKKDQLVLIAIERLQMLGIDYEIEKVVDDIIKYSGQGIYQLMDFLKKCVLLVRAEYGSRLTAKIVEKAQKLI